MVYSGFWTWLHLLQLCIANHCVDPEDDAVNKPWRPIPSGLISVASARTLHLILLPSCLCLSAWLGPQWHTISLALAGAVYHELHFHEHWVTRNVCNAWFYGSLNAGAAMVAGGTFYVFIHTHWTLCNNNRTLVLGQSVLTTRTATSVTVNSLIIFSTIQSQDFRDRICDEQMARWTIPIMWPTGGRISMLVILTTWSVGLSCACDIAYRFCVPFCMLGVFIGMRFIRKRTADGDQQSYQYYNVGFQCCGDVCSRVKPLPPLQIWLMAAEVVHTPMVMTAFMSRATRFEGSAVSEIVTP